MTMRMVRCLGLLPENLTMRTVLRIVVEIVFTSHLTENIKTSPKIIETRKEESKM